MGFAAASFYLLQAAVFIVTWEHNLEMFIIPRNGWCETLKPPH